MSLKQKYTNWDNITDAIRPIWSNTNKQIRGNLDLWKIIHSVSATPDLWQEAMDVVPVVRDQHKWLFNKNAPKLDEDLREIKNRIARNEAITLPGQQEYNKPAYRAVMSIKDIWMDIKDNDRSVDLPDDVLTTDLFADKDAYDDALQAALGAYYDAISAFRQVGLEEDADWLDVKYQALGKHFEQRLKDHDNDTDNI